MGRHRRRCIGHGVLCAVFLRSGRPSAPGDDGGRFQPRRSSPLTLHWSVMKIETRAVHAGRHIDPATGAVTPPIHLSTTFERSPEGDYPRGYSYSREDNPNRHALEECLASLEGGKHAICFSSGLAVATASPEEKQMACLPPSSEARHSSSAWRLGLSSRE